MPVEAEEGPKGGVSLSEIEYLLIFLFPVINHEFQPLTAEDICES